MTFATAGGIEWEKNTSTTTLTIRPASSPESGYSVGQMKEYSAWGGPPWGTIGSRYSYTLVIEDGVTNIGNYAFFNSPGIKSTLTIPATVTGIGDYAFGSCTGLTGDLVIPDSVTTIDDDAFTGCTKFTSLTIGNGVTSVGESAFRNCSGLTGTLTIPNSITTVSADAFNGCPDFTDVKFLGNQPTIGSNAFQFKGTAPANTYDVYSNGWANATTFPAYTYTKWNYKSTKNIDGGIEWVKDDTTKTLTIKPTDTPETGYTSGQMKDHSGDAPWGTIADSGWTLDIQSGVTNIGDQAFTNCSGFTGSLAIPDTVTTIGYYSFQECTGFTGALVIPNNVTSIGDGAFARSTGFTSLTIGDGVTSIGGSSFYNLFGVTGTITIPATVTSIGNGAFMGCYAIDGMKFNGSEPTFGDYALAVNTRSGSTATYLMDSSFYTASNPVPTSISSTTIWIYPKSMYIKVNGSWVSGTPFVKVGGVWKQGTPYIKVGGTWK